MSLKHKLGNVAVICLFIYGVESYGALDSQVSAGLKEEWIDNVFYSSSDRRHDFLTELSVDLTIESIQEVYDLALDYNFSNENYLRDSFGGSNYMEGQGSLNLPLLPRKLSWRSEISSSVTLRESLSPNDPDNRDQRNSAQTGLDYIIINTGRNEVSLEGSVSIVRFRESEINNSNRGALELVWSHSLNKITSLGMNCLGEKVDFIEDAADYEVVDCRVNYYRDLVNGTASLNLGKSSVNPPVGKSIKGSIYEFDIYWRFSGGSDLSITVLRDITDTTIGFSDVVFEGGVGPIDINTDIRAITARKRTEVRYSYQVSRRDNINIVVYRDSDDLYDTNLDTDREGFDLGYSRGFSDSLSADATYSFVKTEYAEGTENFEVDYDEVYNLSLTKRYSRHFNISALLEAQVRRAPSDFDEYEVYSARIEAEYTF